VSDVVVQLRNAGLLVPLGDGGLVPGRPLDRITLLDVRRALFGSEPPIPGGGGLVPAIVHGVEDQAAEKLAETSFRALCDQERGASMGGLEGARPSPEKSSGLSTDGGPGEARG